MRQKQLGIIAVSVGLVFGIGLVGVVAGVPFLDNSGDSENSNGDETAAGDEPPAADDEVVFDQGTPLEINPADAVISGTAPVEEGTELKLSVQSPSGADEPFIVPESTTAGEDGEFAVEMTIPDEIEAGTEAKVSVGTEDETLKAVDATVAESSDQLVSIDSPTVTDPAIDTGDTVEITLSLDGTDSATVTVGDLETTNVRFTATVSDEDNSGDVAVRFDSSGFDGSNAGFIASDGTTLDATTSEYHDDLESLDEGTYDIVVSPGDDAHYDGGTATDRSVITLSDG